LLTLEAAARRGLRVVGLVVSHTTRDLPPADRRNLELLLERLPVPFLGELAHGARQLPARFDPAAFLSALVPV
jgi:dethiobiotin synthetase